MSRLTWYTFKPKDNTTATQLRRGDTEVLGLYWHLNGGYKLTRSSKIHLSELDARKALVNSEIQKRRNETRALLIELELLTDINADGSGMSYESRIADSKTKILIHEA